MRTGLQQDRLVGTAVLRPRIPVWRGGPWRQRRSGGCDTDSRMPSAPLRCRRFRDCSLKLIAAAFTSLLFLGAVELTLRLLLGPPPPAVHVFSGVGPMDTFLQRRGDRVFALYDAVSPLPSFAANPAAPWVAVLGGSTVHGGSRQCSLPLEFPGRLQELIGVDVVNLGNPGRDSHDVVRIAAELLDEWPPSVLVVYTGHNDYANAYFQQRYADLVGGVRARLEAVAAHSQLLVQLQLMNRSWQGIPREINPGEHGCARDRVIVSQAQRVLILNHLEANLRRLSWLCRVHRVPLVLVVPAGDLLRPPVASDCSHTPCAQTLFLQALAVGGADEERMARLLAEARDLDTVPLRAPTAALEMIRAVAASEPGVSLVDADADLPRKQNTDIPAVELFVDHVHLSASGHQALAELLAPVVRPLLSEAAP